uniref:ERAP1_C domain-containing protein n=1 Tax=Anisakis simplex TaxID=6269 RepID=A0A0M3JA87_ANISI
LNWDRVLKIGLYLAKETEYAPFLAFRQTIRDFITMFSATSSNAVDKDNWDLVKRYLQKVIGPIYDKVGWKNSSDWTQRMLASLATEYACKLSYSDCRQKASTSFIDFKTNCEMSRSGTGLCNSMVPDLRRTQYCWGVHENPESMDVVEKLYRWFVDNSRYFHRDTENLLEAQACTTDATQLKEYVCWYYCSCYANRSDPFVD